MDAFIREYAWFLVFWGTIVLFGAIELLFPQFPEHADRTRRWPTNFGLGILNSLILSSVPVLSVGSAQWAASHDVGVLNWIAAPWWVVLPCTLLTKSLGQYVFHLLSHKFPSCGGCIAFIMATYISTSLQRCALIRWKWSLASSS